MDSAIKKHFLYIGLLLLSILIVYRDHLIHFFMIRGGDLLGLYYFSFTILKETLLQYHQFPFWSAAHMGGFPFFGYTQMMVLYPTTLFVYFFDSMEAMLNVILLVSLFFAGLFMYILMNKFGFDPKISLVGALFFTFNGFIRWFSFGWLGRLNAYIWFPLIFFAVWKALHSKQWFKYSLLTGLFLAFQYYSSGVNIFLYSVIIFISIYAVFLLQKNLVQRLSKIVVTSILVIIVLFGLVSFQLVPLLEFSKLSSQSGFTFERAVGNHVEIDSPLDVLQVFVLPFPGDSFRAARIGFIGFFFLLFALPLWRKKYIMVLLLILLLSLLIGAGTNVYYLLWKFVPGFDKVHHVDRAMGLFAFAASFLAAVGFAEFFKKIRKKIKKNHRTVLYFVLIALIVFELGVFREFETRPWIDYQDMVARNEVMAYASDQEGIFRIHNFNTRIIAGQATSYSASYGLSLLYGVTSVWIPEYFNVYLGVSNREPAKFWGMLNTKYVYSREPLNVSGLQFIDGFVPCEDCFEDPVVDAGVSGPYLYENNLFLPRAYFTENAILIVGNPNDARQIMYALMLNPLFNPADTVIIVGSKTSINDYSLDFLNRFNAIVLTSGSIDQNSVPALNSYVNQGGVLLPNVVEGQNTINDNDVLSLLGSFDKGYDEVAEASHLLFSPNKQIISTQGRQGFLVLAEKFYMFESWRAAIDGKSTEILQANGVNSAILLSDGTQQISVKYRPKYFALTLTSMLVVFFGILGYLVYDWRRHHLEATKTN